VPVSTSAIRGNLGDREVRGGVAAAICIALAQAAVHVTNRAWWRSDRLNADVDGNVLTWLTSSVLLAAAVGTLVLAISARSFQLLLLSSLLALFAVDDVIALHERLSFDAAQVLGLERDFARVLWPALYFPLLAFAFLTLWRLGDAAPRSRVVIRMGLASLTAAVGLEIVWAGWHLTRGHAGDWPDTFEVAIEEGLELGGWILIAFGLGTAAVRRFAWNRLTAQRPDRAVAEEADG
jgi:hypothetical protein